jgi:hypothetical protein
VVDRVGFSHENVGVLDTQPGTTQHGCVHMHCTWKSDLRYDLESDCVAVRCLA